MAYIGSKPADKVLTASDITDGVVSTAKIADNAVTADKTSYKDVPYRNILINGDMSIAQRATTASSITAGGYNTVDRWYFNLSNQGTWTQSQDTDVPSGQGFATSLKLDNTTADASPASTDFLNIQQRIEGQNLQHLKKGTASAEDLTVSFWVKSVKTGTYICELRDDDNTRSISKSYTVDSGSTWEKKEITFAGDTTGALDNDNARSFNLFIWLGAGSNYTSGTLATSWESKTNANRAVGQVNLADSDSNNFWITGIQLEVGSSASDFEFLPYDVNLRRCYRYYQTYTVMGTMGARLTTNVEGSFEFHTTMRAAPSAAQETDKVFRDMYAGTFTQSSPSIGITDSSSGGLFVGYGNLTGMTQGRVMCPTDGITKLSAEL